MKCEICNIEVSDINFLNRHMSNCHKEIDRKLYYDTYLKYENEDICRNCGCTTKYINLLKGYEKLCHKCSFNLSHTKICIICGEEFVSRDKRKIVCNKSSCLKAYGHIQYKNKTTTCICSICGNTYEATIKQSKNKCKDCIKKTKNYTTKETFEQIIGCKFCGKPIKTVIKHKSSRSAKQLNWLICDDCRKLHAEQKKQYMRLNNPSYKGNNLTLSTYKEKQELKEYYQSEEYKIKRRQEIKEKISKNMKENNPMYNKETCEKVSKTTRTRYETGEIKKVFGKDHWNYKGSRTIKGYLRLCLGEWIKNNLVRTDYTCEVCHTRGGILHVHHKEPFADLVDRGLKELNLDINTMEFRDDNYQKLEQWILDYHNTHDIGLVVCRKCHAEVDKRYHAPKKLYED